MKKVKQNWKERLALYFEIRAKKEKGKEYLLAKENVLHLIFKDRTTEESLNFYKDISEIFVCKMRERSLEVKRENELLDKFLSVF